MKSTITLCLTLSALWLATGTVAAQAQEAAAAPAATGCGRISVFDVAPRSKDLYRARLLEIDGQLAGPTSSRSFRVSTGHHTLKVAELIDDEQFNGVQLRQRGQGRDLSKMLEIDVAPDTTYMLAAHFIEERRNNILDQSYWEPVIYQQSTEPCR